MILKQGLALNIADALPRDTVEVNTRHGPPLDVESIRVEARCYIVGRLLWQDLAADPLGLDGGQRLTAIAETGAKPFAPPMVCVQFRASAIDLSPNRGLKGHAKGNLTKMILSVCEGMLASRSTDTNSAPEQPKRWG